MSADLIVLIGNLKENLYRFCGWYTLRNGTKSVAAGKAGAKSGLMLFPKYIHVGNYAQAKTRGLERYHGKPCKYGHIERYTNSRGCVECPRTRKTRERPSRAKPVKAPPVEATPAAYEPEKALHRDPGTRVSQTRIDACIDRIYGGAARLGTAKLAESEAA